MKLTISNQGENEMCLLMEGAGEVFANTLRRLVLEEVPTLAVEDVEIRANSSALYDEMLALRLGLTPLKTDLTTYEHKDNVPEDERESARCELKITLSVNKKGYVYAEEAKSSDPSCTFVHPKMPLAKLLAKQKIDLTMTAILGRGKEHIKFAPGLAYYKQEPKIEITKNANVEQVNQENKDAVFVIEGNTIKVDLQKAYESNLLDYYNEKLDGIKVSQTENIVFFLESWGQLSCKGILDQCATILLNKIEILESML